MQEKLRLSLLRKETYSFPRVQLVIHSEIQTFNLMNSCHFLSEMKFHIKLIININALIISDFMTDMISILCNFKLIAI